MCFVRPYLHWDRLKERFRILLCSPLKTAELRPDVGALVGPQGQVGVLGFQGVRCSSQR